MGIFFVDIDEDLVVNIELITAIREHRCSDGSVWSEVFLKDHAKPFTVTRDKDDVLASIQAASSPYGYAEVPC